jgi:aldose 1-epimerase
MRHAPVETFGTTPGGDPVHLLRLENGGSRAAVMSWGASLQDYRVQGWGAPVILGSPDFSAYLGPLLHCGAIAGRVANRIAKGRAMLQGRVVALDRNENGKTCLHGGARGTSLRNWTIAEHDSAQVVLKVTLPDGEGGFPGRLDITARYALEEDGALRLTLSARTDAPTFCNLAHHAYWSFAPEDGLQHHDLTLPADSYLPVDADLIPLGPPASLDGTRFDFRKPRAVKRAGDALLDHNFCFAEPTQALRPLCCLDYGPMRLEVEADSPGLQIYEGAHLDTGLAATLTGMPYGANAGVAIEPQAWPDAPNHPEYPDIRLNPDETYRQVSRFHPHVRD